MGIFDGFRDEPAPALYGEERNPVSQDLVIVGLLVAFGMILFSFMFGILPGVAGGFWKVRAIGEILFIHFQLSRLHSLALLGGSYGFNYLTSVCMHGRGSHRFMAPSPHRVSHSI